MTEELGQGNLTEATRDIPLSTFPYLPFSLQISRDELQWGRFKSDLKFWPTSVFSCFWNFRDLESTKA